MLAEALGHPFYSKLNEALEAAGEPTDPASLQRGDRKRKKQKASNKEWVDPHDPEAQITKMKDGRKRLAYKAEQAVDSETGAIVATTTHPWLETQRFDQPPQQIVLEEYVEAVRAAQARTAALTKQLFEAAEDWSLWPAAQAAMALRGIDRTAGITLTAELDSW